MIPNRIKSVLKYRKPDAEKLNGVSDNTVGYNPTECWRPFEADFRVASDRLNMSREDRIKELIALIEREKRENRLSELAADHLLRNLVLVYMQGAAKSVVVKFRDDIGRYLSKMEDRIALGNYD